MRSRVLLISDDPDLRVILRANLECEGCEVRSADTGEEGVDLALRERPALILLDVLLPRMNGYQACRKIRALGCKMPIVIIAARNSAIDRAAGLGLGATDYVGRPFAFDDLLGRARRQLPQHQSSRRAHNQFAFGDVVVDLQRHWARRGAATLDLSPREFELLEYFIGRQGELVTREELLHNVWGYQNLPLTRTVDNVVATLGRKIERDPRDPRHLTTVRGAGYRFLP
jgi:DNA-binding response OmpR family regulator